MSTHKIVPPYFTAGTQHFISFFPHSAKDEISSLDLSLSSVDGHVVGLEWLDSGDGVVMRQHATITAPLPNVVGAFFLFLSSPRVLFHSLPNPFLIYLIINPYEYCTTSTPLPPPYTKQATIASATTFRRRALKSLRSSPR